MPALADPVQLLYQWVGRRLKAVGGVAIGDKELCAFLYADLTADTPVILQAMIDEVAAYTSQWRLSLNTKKTQVMVAQPS